MPWMLRGIDGVVYSVFQAAGAKVSVHPVLVNNDVLDLRYLFS